MLTGIHPILNGELLRALDAMGHSDAVVVADAHFPAERVAQRLVVLPGLAATDVLGAIRTVIPLDSVPSLDLMSSADGSRLPIHGELIQVAGSRPEDVRYLSRQGFYELASEAFLIVRTGEVRVYGNAILRKGVVT